MILYQIFHNFLHIILPLPAAKYLSERSWQKAWFIMVSAYLIDLDHFLASPFFDPGRCSIGFHPLHSFYAIGLYAFLACFPKTRILAAGLLIHIFVDITDCIRIYFN